MKQSSYTLSEQGRVSLSPDAPQLDERLLLAASLYPACELAADVGTDHGLLPCHLLLNNVCRRMILADVSEKSLQHARDSVARYGLESRAALVCADGLDAVTAPCGCVSVMGMGGETMAEILRRGAHRLQGATLVLSAHTEPHLVRRAVCDIGYRIAEERLCRAAGRFYVFWRCLPGESSATQEEIRYGKLLWQEPAALLKDYVAWRISYLKGKIAGLGRAAAADDAALTAARADLDFYEARLEEIPC